MLRIHGGLSEVPKPGCSGTNTSKCLERKVEHRQPDRQAIGAVQKQERRSRSAPQHPDVDVADLVFCFRPRHGIVLRDFRAKQSTDPNAPCNPERRPNQSGTYDRSRHRTFPPAPLYRAAGADWANVKFMTSRSTFIDVAAVLEGKPEGDLVQVGRAGRRPR